MESDSKGAFQDLTKKYYRNIIYCKSYFSKITLIHLLQSFNREKILPFSNPNTFFDKQISIQEKKIFDNWNFDHLLELLNFLNDETEKNSNLIDIISFNIIPSISLFFIEEESFHSFINFINQLSDKPSQFHILFSRPLFVSPLFTNFIYKTFYYHIIEINPSNYKKANQILIEKVRKQILNSFTSNFEYFPECISIFLKKIKNKKISKEIFKHAFCDCLIENPSMYFATDYWQICYQRKSEEISNFLRAIINDQMIDDMLQIIEEKNNYLISFLSKETTSFFHQFIINNTVIDNIDLISMKFIESYEKNSQNIYDVIINEKLENYSFFYLMFKNIEIEFDDQELNTSSIDKIQIEFINQYDVIYNIDDNLRKHFDAFMLMDILAKEEANLPFKFLEVIENQHKYHQQLENFITTNQKKSFLILNDQDCSQIFALYFYQNLTFYDFLSNRSDLNKYDLLVYNFILDNKSTFFEDNFNKLPEVCQKLYFEDHQQFDEYAIKLNNILEDDSNPYSKAIHISKIIFEILKKYDGRLFIDFDLAASLLLLFFIYLNSQKLISNTVFIFQLMNWDEIEWDNNSKVIAFQILEAVVNIIKSLGEFSFNFDSLIGSSENTNKSLPAQSNLKIKIKNFFQHKTKK